MPTKKQAKLKTKRAKKQTALRLQRQEQKSNVVYQMYWIIQRFFPNLFDWMREIEDYRRKPKHELAAILTACIAVFLFGCIPKI